ncbi:MAG: indolepyruvate oxidoreductase subunit beta [Coriobacteriales bacterium]|nr:indolepyruvate oxidoreductase subunit beta [Coriobacteriales bacterium]
MDTKTILLVGVGGQGTILAGDIIAKVAMQAGLDVKISEIHGMSQRGGSVSTVVRYGSQVYSMVEPACGADYIVAFEPIEALRYIDKLSPEGKILANEEVIIPMAISLGTASLDINPIEKLHELGAKTLDAKSLALQAGSDKCTNIVILGALSKMLDFDYHIWIDVIKSRVPSKTIDMNLAAFELGQNSI